MFVVGRKVNVLSMVEGGEKRQTLRGEVIHRVIKMNVKVTSVGSGERKEGMEVIKKNSLV